MNFASIYLKKKQILQKKKDTFFLGFELKISPRGRIRRVYYQPNPKSPKLCKTFKFTRYTAGPVWISPDKQRLINRFFMKGFCTRRRFPRELLWLACLEPQVIIQRYNAVLLGLSNFYIGHIRNRTAMHRWIYIIRFSCLKTFA